VAPPTTFAEGVRWRHCPLIRAAGYALGVLYTTEVVGSMSHWQRSGPPEQEFYIHPLMSRGMFSIIDLPGARQLLQHVAMSENHVQGYPAPAETSSCNSTGTFYPN
jgi:hypothetical protein